jgi:hypothetical protein
MVNKPGYRRGTMRLPDRSLGQAKRWFAGLPERDTLIVSDLESRVVADDPIRRLHQTRS